MRIRQRRLDEQCDGARGAAETAQAAAAEPRYSVEVDTPLGRLRVTAVPAGVVEVDWLHQHEVLSRVEAGPDRVDLRHRAGDAPTADTAPAPGQLEAARMWAQRAAEELEAYMAGRLREFTVPLVLRTGTPFQRAVWQALRSIPYGETRSYLDVAAAVGNPRAVRAVGQANRANPLPILIPCHRVIGRRGDLVGYDGQQVHLKAALLDLERRGQAAGQVSSASGG